jgi:hypothetical protein
LRLTLRLIITIMLEGQMAGCLNPIITITNPASTPGACTTNLALTPGHRITAGDLMLVRFTVVIIEASQHPRFRP